MILDTVHRRDSSAAGNSPLVHPCVTQMIHRSTNCTRGRMASTISNITSLTTLKLRSALHPTLNIDAMVLAGGKRFVCVTPRSPRFWDA